MSIKGQLYKFIKNIIIGGAFTDNLDNIFTESGIPAIKEFEFWNSQLTDYENKDNIFLPALFFEFNEISTQKSNLSSSMTDSYFSSKDTVNFTLHLITDKPSAENRENDYLDMLDLAEVIFSKIQGKGFSNCIEIVKSGEVYDSNSGVLQDWQISFDAIITNTGLNVSENANDIGINPYAPVEQLITVVIDS